MNKLDYGKATDYARDFTVTAMEEGYIAKYADEEETAKHITQFFKSIVSDLTED